MTCGALIFAFNNEATDYVSMAEWSAGRIRQHLGIPVAVVTNSQDPVLNKMFDRVIYAEPESGGTRFFEDYNSTVTWHNAGRADAYALTPWEQTLVLDADYVVASSQLSFVIDSNRDFMCHDRAYDIAKSRLLDELNTFGEHRLPMSWATVMMFRKSNTAAYIFDCMQMVRDNWDHYRALYKIQKSTYRNDFALSIALGIISGGTWRVDSIPWSLASILPEYDLEQIAKADETFKITHRESTGRILYSVVSGTDFHAMGKKHLGDIIAANS
jgi:hypothetical protein